MLRRCSYFELGLPVKRFEITTIIAIAWGQEEGMDEDTAMWKEGVRVRSFMETQKGKNLIWKVI